LSDIKSIIYQTDLQYGIDPLAFPRTSRQEQVTKNLSCSTLISGDLSTTFARENYVFTFWKCHGLTDDQAAAVVGTLEGEGSRGKDVLDPSILGGWHGLALGIGQWLGERKQRLLK